ncbi:MAG: hypothetical protein V4733_05515 [Verrucomicrobiota bacterium]
MKLSSISMALCSVITPLSAQDQEEVHFTAETGITGDISDGKPELPAPKPEPTAFGVERSVTKRVHVVEAPESTQPTTCDENK